MSNVETMMKLTKAHNLVLDVVRSVTQDIADMFEGDWTTNQESENHYIAHMLMAEYVIVSTAASTLKKKVDKTKLDLDEIVETLGRNPNPEPGITKEIYSNSFLAFSKKQNAEGTTVTVKDLEIELNKLGVDPSIIKKAIDNAERPRKGNTYYMVGASEGT